MTDQEFYDEYGKSEGARMSGAVVFLISFVTYFMAIVAYDVWLIMNKKETISSGMKTMGKHAPILAFMLGLVVGTLAGHFWFPV